MDRRRIRLCVTEKAKTLAANLARPGDIIFTQRGTLGQVSLVPSEPYERYLISQSQMKLTVDCEKADPLFLYYVFRSPAQQEYIQVRAIQTGVPHTNLGILRNTPVPVPPLAKQRAIARILGSLDDKIELNRGMNMTLEAMAGALFKSWFVDFDPVRAKREGRDPGLPDFIADLFPVRLVDSQLGEIPEGWSIGRLDDVIVLQRGFDLPSSARSNGPYPVLAASGPSGFHNEFMVCGPGVTTGRSGVLGNVFFVHNDFWPLNTSLWVKEFKRATPAYAFHLLRCLDFGLFNAGSAVPTLNRNHIHNLPALLPPSELVEVFDRAVAPMLRRERCAEEESTRLAELRDALLSKLISGELRIRGGFVDGDTG
jgi:type I restriction enzyme S subunit